MFLLTTSLSLFLAVLPGAQAAPVDAREDVHRVIDAWKRVPETPQVELTQALVSLGGAATGYLCELLDSDYPGAPVEPLAEAIGRVGHRNAPETLGRLLSSGVESERSVAVEALGNLRVREACPHLLRALDDAERSVVKRVEAILLEKHQLESWVARAVRERLRVVKDMGSLGKLLGEKGGEETHELLVELVGDWRPDFQLAGLQGLYVDGRPEDGEVVTQVMGTDGARAVRMQAALVLGKLRFTGGVRSLIDQLYEDDQGLCSNAHWALKRITGLKLKADPGLWEQWWERKGKLDAPQGKTAD